MLQMIIVIVMIMMQRPSNIQHQKQLPSRFSKSESANDGATWRTKRNEAWVHTAEEPAPNSSFAGLVRVAVSASRWRKKQMAAVSVAAEKRFDENTEDVATDFASSTTPQFPAPPKTDT